MLRMEAYKPADAAVAEVLARRLGAEIVSALPEAMRHEPRGLIRGGAGLLLRPRTTQEVASILSFAQEERIAVVPYGGGTGLVGGQIMPHDAPACAPLYLSLARMSAIAPPCLETNSIEVEAGATLDALRAAAAEAGRLFPLSLASSGSCQIGGNLATNAGGVQVLHYGTMRDLCLGVEAVTATGEIYHGLRALRKDNTGYDLRHLLIGSEGTLGVITKAVLCLFPAPKARVTVLVALRALPAAIALMRALESGTDGALTAFELISATSFSFLEEAGLGCAPLSLSDWAVLFEVSGQSETQLTEQIFAVMEAAEMSNAVMAQNERERAELWALRERIPEANRAIGAIASHDISLPLNQIAAFLSDADAALAPHQLRINCFGHLGDGNLHYNLFPPDGRGRAEYAHKRAELMAQVHALTASFGGSISAEHGVGRLKAEDFARHVDPVKQQMMRAIKAALDPRGILNPGVYAFPE